MSKITKIDTVRTELSRIASHKDRADIFSPTMQACWSFPKVMIIGKLKMQSFDFDQLVETLGKIPPGAGEAFFWNFLTEEVADVGRARPLSQRGVVVQLKEHRRLKKV